MCPTSLSTTMSRIPNTEMTVIILPTRRRRVVSLSASLKSASLKSTITAKILLLFHIVLLASNFKCLRMNRDFHGILVRSWTPVSTPFRQTKTFLSLSYQYNKDSTIRSTLRWQQQQLNYQRQQRRFSVQSLLFAKKRNRDTTNSNNNNNIEDDLDHWYDEVDQNKSPDDIFWEEMERQQQKSSSTSLSPGGDGTAATMYSNLLSGIPSSSSTSNGLLSGGNGVGGIGRYGSPLGMGSSGGGGGMNSFSGVGGGGSGGYPNFMSSGSGMQYPSSFASPSLLNGGMPKLTPKQQQVTLKGIDATLSEYSQYIVSDNWLDDDLLEFMLTADNDDDNDVDDDTFFTSVPSLDEQLDAWEAEGKNNHKSNNSLKQQNATTDKDAVDDDDDEDEDDEYEYYYGEEEGDDDDDDENAWMQSDEPWDHWTAKEDMAVKKSKVDTSKNKQTKSVKEEYDYDDDDRVRIDPEKILSGPASQFLFKYDDTDEDDDDDDDDDSIENGTIDEIEYIQRLSQIPIKSERLDRAQSSPKAKLYFSKRKPDAMEGFDRLWVSAIDNACFQNLVGTFRNYGIEFADNFGDWEDAQYYPDYDTINGISVNPMIQYTIEEIASAKARLVYNVTGLPCIASRTSWEIEPVPDWNQILPLSSPEMSVALSSSYPSAAVVAASGGTKVGPPGGSSSSSNSMGSPRVVSGYRFNDIGNHVDYISDALRPISDPNRVTRFKTCMCFYDGEIEIFDYGTADVDLYFCNSLRTFIPVAQAINEMMKTIELTFGLEYQKWMRTRIDEIEGGTRSGSARSSTILGPDGEVEYQYGAASVKLRDRVLKEGKVLPNDIIDVSAFMDSMVDVNLMDECAEDLSNRFFTEKPTKILTVATTGLVIALPMAKYLQVPVVYARKERNVVMADTYIAGYSSKTVGKNRELLVSKLHLHADDRVLIVDDFLSSGSSQEALLRIVSESGATAVGVGVLLEKSYDSGRQSLSGFNIPIHSLCRIASVYGGVIQLMEEDGFDKMKSSS